VIDPAFHRLAHLGAEPGAGGRLVPREKLAVYPCRTAGTHLLLDRQVGAGGEGQSLAAGGIVVRACLDNRTGPGVAGQFQVGEAEMMGAPINAFDDCISRTLELVLQPSGCAFQAIVITDSRAS